MKNNLLRLGGIVLTALLFSQFSVAKTVTQLSSAFTRATEAPRTLDAEADIRPALSRSPLRSAHREVKWAGTPYRSVRRAPGVAPSNLMGCVLQSYNPDFVIGIHSIPLDEGAGFNLIAPYVVAPYGGVKVGDVYYAAQMQDYFGNIIYMIEAWDTNTWTSISQEYVSTPSMMASDAAYDPTTGKVYGCYYNNDRSGWIFASADYENLTSTFIRDLPKGWNAVACAPDGTLYAIDRSGDLYTVDKSNGDMTLIGSTGLSPQNLSSGAIDPRTGRFFYAVHSSAEAALYEINPATAEATWLMDFDNNEEITGMWVDEPLAEDEAPAAVTGLKVKFEGASLSGTVSFKAPDKLFNNTSASGTFTYTITANGKAVASGDADAGENVTAEITVPEAGTYEISVSVANNVGSGPSVSTSLFIGPGTPVMTPVSLKRNGDNFIVSWLPVTESTDGGFIDAGAVEYTVTRYPDETVVATTRETVVTDPVAEPDVLTTFYYTVAASVGGLTSEPVASDNIVLGAIIPPYSPVFTDDADWDAFTVIDSNGDYVIWMPDYETGAARLTYNPTLDSDDWMITPAIKMAEGQLYKLDFDIFGRSPNFPERIEVKMGTESTVAGMTTTLVSATELRCNSENPVHKSIDIIAPSTGVFYIGFHGISDKDKFGLYVANLSLTAGIAPGAPAAVSDFTVVPDFNGALTAAVSLTVPSVDISGNTLTSVDRVDISRGNEVIKTFENPQPGEALTFEDTVESADTYVYTAVAVNEEGAGYASSAKVFIGINEPSPVSSLEVIETLTRPGEITLTWKAPETDKDGNPVNPALLTYSVAEVDGDGNITVLKSGLTDCTYTWQAVAEGKLQELKEWAVFAEAGDRKSTGVSVMAFAGEAFDAPYSESFADGALTRDLMVDIIAGESEWRLIDDSLYADIKSVDSDNGFISMTGFKDATSAIVTGKINIPETNPGIMFHVYNVADELYNEDEIDIEVNDGNGWTRLNHLVMNTLGTTPGWNRRYVGLSDYAGKTLQVRFHPTVHTWSTVYLDNIMIGTLPVNDLRVVAVECPSRVHADKEFTISATVENLGTAVAEPSSYSVKLYCNDVEVASAGGKRVRSCARVNVEFTSMRSVTDSETANYHVVVVMDADENTADNASEPVTVTRILPLHPVVTDLHGAAAQGGISLSWSEPDTNLGSPAEHAESFEDGESFAVDRFADWIFIDADGAPTHPVQDLELPSQGAPMAYVVVDASLETMNETWAAADGTKYLAAFCSKGKPNDDWAVSPLLYGGPQTVSFMARTYSDRYGAEEFEFYYSTSGTEIQAFVKIGQTEKVPFSWTPYSFELPAGAQYFAIRCISDDCFIFMLDDVKFYPAAGVSAVSLLGYNIYRDGKRLNDHPVEDLNYLDADAGEGDHTYWVTALYDLGESAPVAVTVSSSAIDAIVSATLKISVSGHDINIDGAESDAVAIYGIDGKTWFNEIVNGHTTVTLPTGLYIVSIPGTALKVLVK